MFKDKWVFLILEYFLFTKNANKKLQRKSYIRSKKSNTVLFSWNKKKCKTRFSKNLGLWYSLVIVIILCLILCLQF